MPMCVNTLLVLPTYELVSVASILWPQLHPQKFVDGQTDGRTKEVTAAKSHAYAQLHLMGSTHIHIGRCGINILAIAAPTRIPRSRSSLQGQRSQQQNIMPILWPQLHPQKFVDGQTDGRMEEVTAANSRAYAQLHLMGDAHIQSRKCGINNLAAVASTTRCNQ